MARDFYPNLDVTELEKLLAAAQQASVRGVAASVSTSGLSTSRDTSKVDTENTISRLLYSLYLRTGGLDPKYPNPYANKVTRVRARFDTTIP